MAALPPDDLARYARHLNLPQVGVEGQAKLAAASVFCVGAGGLGAPVLAYLAAAGVGRITLIDDDVGERSNLQRQVLFTEADVGRSKAAAAAARLSAQNPSIEVAHIEARLTSANAMELIEGHDILIDGTDNIPTRYLVNDVAELLGIPWVYGSIFRFEGQVSVFNLDGGPTYRDLFPSPPPPDSVPSCADGGGGGVLPGVVGSAQANEALKVILGIGQPLRGQLLVFDALAMSMRKLTFEAIEREPVTKLIDYAEFCGMKKEDEAVGEDMRLPFQEIDVQAYLDRRASGWSPLFVDTRTAHEQQIITLPETDCLIPHEEVLLNQSSLPKDRDIVFYCRTGGRSGMAAFALTKVGYDGSRLYNLVGGVHAWSDIVDSTVPKY